jgi:hypothetical protein
MRRAEITFVDLSAVKEGGMSKARERWRDPSFILDVAQALVAFIVAIVLALDMTGIWSNVPWLSDDLTGFTFIAVCVLIVSSFLERRIILERLTRTADQKLDGLILRQQELLDEIRISASPGTKLENRRGYVVPFEIRLAETEHIDLLGMSLKGVISIYGGFLFERAIAGCKFRFLLLDPRSPAVSAPVGFMDNATSRKLDIEQSVRFLEQLLRTGNAELRFTPFAPPFGLVIADPEKPDGIVQVELYQYEVAQSERPHFLLTRDNKRWYEYFWDQFERIWSDARPHEVAGEC